MEESIYETLHYFALFSYPPTIEELWTFLKKKTSKKNVKQLVYMLSKSKKLITDTYANRVTLAGYPSFFSMQKRRNRITEEKKKKVGLYMKILSYIPWIQLVGYSGSVSMNNAVEADDIDVFIIAKSQRLWTARFCAVLTALLLRIKRPRNVKYAANTVCLNLFFDERDMHIPPIKQTAYVAHEVLQMKVIFQKYRTYMHFIESNDWVFTFYPNARTALTEHMYVDEIDINSVITYQSFAWLGWVGEGFFQFVQRLIMQKRRTKERVGETQLWFFPDDFEDKVKTS